MVVATLTNALTEAWPLLSELLLRTSSYPLGQLLFEPLGTLE